MWYLASIPFAVFLIFLIYKLVSERKVHLAVDEPFEEGEERKYMDQIQSVSKSINSLQDKLEKEKVALSIMYTKLGKGFKTLDKIESQLEERDEFHAAGNPEKTKRVKREKRESSS